MRVTPKLAVSAVHSAASCRLFNQHANDAKAILSNQPFLTDIFGHLASVCPEIALNGFWEPMAAGFLFEDGYL
ncbi:hypothetical protein IH922_06860 [candidate division KSB1 bacterium]|nr:hypothetical protein [candidate division KSB1 bacterium]